MQWILIAGGAFAFIGLVMMAIAVVMLTRGGKRQVKVVLPTSTAAKVPPPPKPAVPTPPPPAPKPEAGPRPEPPRATPPPPPAPKMEPPKATPPPPPPAPEPEAPKAAPPPPPPAPEPEPDPRVSEEGTRIAMIPPPTPIAPPPPEATADPRVSEEGTRIAMIPPPSALVTPPAPPEATVIHSMQSAPEPEASAEDAPQATTAISPDEMADFRTIVEQPAPKSYGSLVGIAGGVEGREAKIDEEGFVIGRDQRTAQFVISDPRISKRHVWIGVREGEVWAVDVGSTNGTYLNVPRSQRITEARLNPGDVVILAEDAARFEYRKG
jgi:hypothetical protein